MPCLSIKDAIWTSDLPYVFLQNENLKPAIKHVKLNPSKLANWRNVLKDKKITAI